MSIVNLTNLFSFKPQVSTLLQTLIDPYLHPYNHNNLLLSVIAQ